MVTGDLSTAPSATAFAYTAFNRWNVFLRGVAPPKLSKLASHRFMSSVIIFVRGYFQKNAWGRCARYYRCFLLLPAVSSAPSEE